MYSPYSQYSFIIPYSTLSLFLQAIETLKGFEKKDSKVQSTAATNLSFLYFLVGFMFSVIHNYIFIQSKLILRNKH